MPDNNIGCFCSLRPLFRDDSDNRFFAGAQNDRTGLMTGKTTESSHSKHRVLDLVLDFRHVAGFYGRLCPFWVDSRYGGKP